MRLKKILYFIIMILLVYLIISLSISIFDKKDKDNNILLGNPISNLNQEVNDTFTSSFMSSSYLLSMINNDASKQVNGKIVKLSNLLKDSDSILIHIGENDIKTHVKENNILIYDIEILQRTSQIILHNIESIINSINLICKNSNLYIYELSYSYQIKDQTLINFYNDLNKKINLIVKKYSETSNVSLFLFLLNF